MQCENHGSYGALLLSYREVLEDILVQQSILNFYIDVTFNHKANFFETQV
jgi:hypothetical protein